MKTKILILTLLFLFPSLIYCQNSESQSLKGSWMGRVTTNDFSLRLVFRFEVKDGLVKGFLDSPDQGFADIPLEKIWNNNDSLFINLGSSTVFKGLMLSGDSII